MHIYMWDIVNGWHMMDASYFLVRTLDCGDSEVTLFFQYIIFVNKCLSFKYIITNRTKISKLCKIFRKSLVHIYKQYLFKPEILAGRWLQLNGYK